MNTFSHKTSGFSLVEISLAIVVIAVGLSVVVVMFPAGLGQNSIAAAETHAAQFAEDVSSSLQAMAKTQPWSDFITDAQDIDIPPGYNANTNKVVLDGQIYTLKFERVITASSATVADSILRYRINRTEKDRVLMVNMEIWPGEWGSTAAADALTYYTEAYDTGL